MWYFIIHDFYKFMLMIFTYIVCFIYVLYIISEDSEAILRNTKLSLD